MEMNSGPSSTTYETNTPSGGAVPVAATPSPVAIQQSSTPSVPQSAPASPAVSPEATPRLPGETQAQAANRAILEGLSKRGLDVSAFESDDSFLDEFQNEYQSLAQTKALAKYGRQFLSQREQFEQFVQSQAGGPQGAKAPAQPTGNSNPQPQANPDDPWGPLEYDERWEEYAQWDGKRYVPRDEYANPAAAEKLNQYHKARADRLNKLARDPYAAMKPLVEREAARIAEERYRQFTQQGQSQSLAEKFISDNFSEWVVMDATGNPRIDPNTGMEQMNAKGLRAFELTQEANELGLPTAEKRLAYVKKMLAAEFPAQAAPQQQIAPTPVEPPPTPEQKQDSFLERAEKRMTGQHRPSTSTAAAQPAVRQFPSRFDQSDFQALVKENAAKVGIKL